VAAPPETAIVMYTTSWCPHCAKARAYLRSRNIPFTDHDIEQSADANAQYKTHGGRGVPLIFVGQQRMNGFSERRMAEMRLKVSRISVRIAVRYLKAGRAYDS
jgi:glutaredoxin